MKKLFALFVALSFTEFFFFFYCSILSFNYFLYISIIFREILKKRRNFSPIIIPIAARVLTGNRELKHQTFFIHERHGWPRRAGSGTQFTR